MKLMDRHQTTISQLCDMCKERVKVSRYKIRLRQDYFILKVQNGPIHGIVVKFLFHFVHHLPKSGFVMTLSWFFR